MPRVLEGILGGGGVFLWRGTPVSLYLAARDPDPTTIALAGARRALLYSESYPSPT
jgi:hypothetical protein